MLKKISLFSIITLFFIVSSGNAAQFYLIEKPSALIIYNSYEARVNDMDVFLSYSPFEVINKEDVLGDGISEVIKVKYMGKTFFILKDDKGNIEGAKNAGSIKTINARASSDTLIVIGNAKIKAGPFPGSKSVKSQINETAYALLKYNNYYYITNSKQNVLGWSSANSWKKVAKSKKNSERKDLSSDQVEKLTDKIKEINTLYKKTFNYYNEKFNESKSVPYWKIEHEGDILTFLLRGSKAAVIQLEESSQYIVQEFLNILLGEPFDVKYRDGKITVSPEEVL